MRGDVAGGVVFNDLQQALGLFLPPHLDQRGVL